MTMPKFVTVQVKDPDTGVTLWQQDHVPIEVLMQVAGSIQQAKGMIGQAAQTANDVKQAFSSLQRMFSKRK